MTGSAIPKVRLVFCSVRYGSVPEVPGGAHKKKGAQKYMNPFHRSQLSTLLMCRLQSLQGWVGPQTFVAPHPRRGHGGGGHSFHPSGSRPTYSALTSPAPDPPSARHPHRPRPDMARDPPPRNRPLTDLCPTRTEPAAATAPKRKAGEVPPPTDWPSGSPYADCAFAETSKE